MKIHLVKTIFQPITIFSTGGRNEVLWKEAVRHRSVWQRATTIRLISTLLVPLMSRCTWDSSKRLVYVILDSQVGDFLILKADNEPTKNGEVKPPLWRVDGKTLIQKYECTDKVF